MVLKHFEIVVLRVLIYFNIYLLMVKQKLKARSRKCLRLIYLNSSHNIRETEELCSQVDMKALKDKVMV